jgi:hypothetical protein
LSEIFSFIVSRGFSFFIRENDSSTNEKTFQSLTETYYCAVTNSCGTSTASITITKTGTGCIYYREGESGPTAPLELDIPDVTDLTGLPQSS